MKGKLAAFIAIGEQFRIERLKDMEDHLKRKLTLEEKEELLLLSVDEMIKVGFKEINGEVK